MTQPKPNFCKNRLPDHTDFYTCGNVTLPNNTYCLACRPEKLPQARQRLQTKEAEYMVAKAAYEALLAEGVPR